MGIEQEISQLKEAFREYINLKIEEDTQKEMDTSDSLDEWEVKYEVEKKYKRIFDALDGNGRY